MSKKESKTSKMVRPEFFFYISMFHIRSIDNYIREYEKREDFRAYKEQNYPSWYNCFINTTVYQVTLLLTALLAF